MGQQSSKEELLYQDATHGNVEGIKTLCREGVGVEWADREGKTPLMVACMDSELYDVAKTLLELGANVNAYGPGRRGGTPLHHAASRGLENTVKLLLSFGANCLIINDACQTPLEVARAAGHKNVVRAIEGHICLFSGWMREFYGPEFLDVIAPQLLSRTVWVVISPCGSRNHMKPFRLELAVYSNLQDAQPRVVIPLWKSNLEEHKLQEADPSVVIVDNTPPSKGRRRRRRRYHSWEAKCHFLKSRTARLRLAPGNEYDRQQLQWFCDACKGIPPPKVMHPPSLQNHQAPVSSVPPGAEDMDLAMAIKASIQSAMEERPHLLDPHSSCEAGASSSGLVPPQPRNASIPATHMSISPVSAPSAPSVATELFEVDAGTVQYPSVDSPHIDVASTSLGNEIKGGQSSSCVICLDAPVEGACVPCGHMAGCMSCLNEVKAKSWGCPVCRTNINQVIKLYAV